MEAKEVSKNLDFSSKLMQLITQEDLIMFSYLESYEGFRT
jgi:hypothetical protein